MESQLICSYSFGARTNGNAIHSRLPQLKEVQEIFEERPNEHPLFTRNNLMQSYVKRGNMLEAWHVFDSMPKRNVVSWNIMILGYAKHEEAARALELYARMCKEGVHRTDRTFVGALKACSSLAAQEERREVQGKHAKLGSLAKGRAVHSQLVRSSFESDTFVGNILVNMYAKCASMEDAGRVFEELPHRDVVTWTTMILGYAEQEESALALDLYAQMHQEGVRPDDRALVGALKACSSLAALEQGQQGAGKFTKAGCLGKGRDIHSQVVNSGFELDSFMGAALVNMYAKCGNMDDAQRVFEKSPHRDVVTWSTMILGFAEQEQTVLALELYAWMHQEGIQPNDRTFVGALKACSSLAALEEGKECVGRSRKIVYLAQSRAIHSEAVKTGFGSDVFVVNSLVNMYAKFGSMEDARCVFEESSHRNVVTWTTLILGYTEQAEIEAAFKLYAEMQEQGLSPSSLTFLAILKACGNSASLETGRELHHQLKKVGFEAIANVATSLIDMYAKCGSMGDAQQLFDALPIRDVVAWNALITGYARQGEGEHVFRLFERMTEEGIQPDGLTFLSILTLCSHAGLVEKGQEYFQIMSNQHGIIPTIDHYTCLVDLLGRVGRVENAVAMVEAMSDRPNLAIWLSVLGACRKWKNVKVGRHAFENIVRLDEKCPSAYILMAEIYANADMQEDCDKIEAMGKIAQAGLLDQP